MKEPVKNWQFYGHLFDSFSLVWEPWLYSEIGSLIVWESRLWILRIALITAQGLYLLQITAQPWFRPLHVFIDEKPGPQPSSFLSCYHPCTHRWKTGTTGKCKLSGLWMNLLDAPQKIADLFNFFKKISKHWNIKIFYCSWTPLIILFNFINHFNKIAMLSVQLIGILLF
jgi:hypothetical protein